MSCPIDVPEPRGKLDGFGRNRPAGDSGATGLLGGQLTKSTLRGVLKRLHFPLEIKLLCVRWYAAYPLSLRNLEEMMGERAYSSTTRRFIAGH
jgi:hypothetical protein